MINEPSTRSASRVQKRTFTLTAPQATCVQLVGDFTRWTEHPIDLHKNTNGTWEATVSLRKGLHLYRFLVDGHWRDDPQSVLRIHNPYGTEDSVIHIE